MDTTQTTLPADLTADAVTLLASCPRIAEYLYAIGEDAVEAVVAWLVGEWVPERALIQRGLAAALARAGWADAYPLAT